MATSQSTGRQRSLFRGKAISRAVNRARIAFRSLHPAWILSAVLSIYIIFTFFNAGENLSLDPTMFPERPEDLDDPSDDNISNGTIMNQPQTSDKDPDLMRRRYENAKQSNFSTMETAFRGSKLGNKFCIIQPTLSFGKTRWYEEDAKQHIALRAFMRTFAETITPKEREKYQFSIYYGYDSDDGIFGNEILRRIFSNQGKNILIENGFNEDDVKFIFQPCYGLHGRLNAIWNVLTKDAYYDGCDYFFLSNDDMIFFTRGWVSRSIDSLNGIGAPKNHKRPCRGFGIVRFKDEWANWATFTFHVSTRLHLEIFSGTYYPVPYHSAHNDYWINFVYRAFDASKYRSEIRVRNRVDNVDYALSHQKDTEHVAPPRYTYDKRGHARLYIHQGIARVKLWLDKYKNTERCPPPL